MKRNQSQILPLRRLVLTATSAGMIAERLLRAFWPLFSLLMLGLSVLMLGLQDMVPVEWTWAGAGSLGLGLLWALVRGARRMHWPDRAEVLARLDATLPGRPVQALLDHQAIGAGDAASVGLWRAHQARMAARVAGARAVPPDLALRSRDPLGLRYMAVLCLAVAVVFGSVRQVSSVAGLAPGAAAAAAGPSWEGWIEPPRYTGLPTLYLNDQVADALEVPQGTRIVLRFYGEPGQLSLAETLSDTPLAQPENPEQSLTVVRSGTLEIEGPGGRGWQVAMQPDQPPVVEIAGEAESGAGGQMVMPYAAADDYGVTGGEARITLDLAAVDRRHGLRVAPEPREAVTIDLPLPISGDRRDFTENLVEDFSQHPWAHLPVTITLVAQDAAGQEAETIPYGVALPARRFFDPLAAAVIEMRRDLLWSRENAARVALILRAVSHRPEEVFKSETAYLRLRVILRRLEALNRYGLQVSQQEEIAQALWDLALLLEDGTLSDALERMRQAQERLSEAMKNGASDQEIAELMQELREATEDYLQQLMQQAQRDGDSQERDGQQGQDQQSLQMTQDDLQRMMDRIQELMEQGRMAEAQQALQEFQQMMENMRVTQGQGQNGQSEGQRAMEGLAETLRNQQGLSDQAFRDLQEQFNPGAQAGENQQNEGRSGGQGRGQSHEGQGQAGREPGSGQDGQGGQPDQGTLADRQQALRDELGRQQQNLPGQGTPEGDAAREALGRAGRAMEGAEDALRQDDLPEAIDRQAEAMEALREGMRSLGEALAQEQQPGQGSQEGDMRAQNRDPLGRTPGSQGGIHTDENLLGGEDVYRRARELLDEIRRRSGERERPQIELDYLKRLLDRF
ncbi:TIGR02302 family protein [Ruegeria sp. WL0004]|uniref:TIGR02302 family protein n=1 Tax=Ruegeria marisflavi TaxID=2984152 RepID=A0ABT2WL14_9RHOB|nr:TIGR02302 family protein [Ruegeria sp. WL0004]MCU9836600.1 TIGR02302 family protein [Ruegeria sp. WL0004]